MLFRAPRGIGEKIKRLWKTSDISPQLCASVCVHVGELHLTHEQGFDLKVQCDNRGV